MARYHIEQLNKVNGVSITALCDVNTTALNEVGGQLNVPESKRYQSIHNLIEDSEVDGILSVTPNDSHATIIKACIVAQKPLFAEKPMTRTLAEAAEVLELYKQQPIPFLINFSYRNGPAFQYARALVNEGKIGRINHLFVQYLQDWGATIKNTPLLWRFDEPITGTGTLGDLGSHMFDLAEYITGTQITDISAMLQTIVPERTDLLTGELMPVRVDDFACMNVKFNDGKVGVFQTSRNALGSQNQHELSLYGETGTLHISTLNDRELVWIYPNEDGNGTVTEKLDVPMEQGLNPWQEFADRIRGEKKPNSQFATLADGYRNQQLLEAVVQSHNRRAMISVDEI